jgi:WD40 repeat protein
VTDVAVSPDDGRQIVSGGADMSVRLWDADTGVQIDRMSPQHKGLVTSVAFSPVGRVVASAGTDGTVMLWRLDTHAVTTYDAGQPLTAVEFNATGDRIAAAGVAGQVFLWNLTSGAKTLLENKDHAIVYGVAFDPKHDRLASVSVNGYLRMWELADGHQLWERNAAAALPDVSRTKEKLVQGDPGSLISVAFSPDGERVASGGMDRTTAAGGAIGFVQRWDADDGTTIGEPIKVGSAVMGIAFSPEQAASGGDQIVVASFDPYEVQLWDADTPSEAKFIFAGHQAQVVSVAVSQDGRRIVSGSADGSLRVWPNLPTGHAEDAICAKLTSNMSNDEWNAWISKEIHYRQTCPGNLAAGAQGPH